MLLFLCMDDEREYQAEHCECMCVNQLACK